MAPNFKKPTRMCVVCRGRFEQHILHRLQCLDGQLILFGGLKRSFYICNDCINGDQKRLNKILNRECKKGGDFIPQLKEITQYVGQN